MRSLMTSDTNASGIRHVNSGLFGWERDKPECSIRSYAGQFGLRRLGFNSGPCRATHYFLSGQTMVMRPGPASPELDARSEAFPRPSDSAAESGRTASS